MGSSSACYFCLLASCLLILLNSVTPANADEKRTLNCKTLCKMSGHSGTIGGCRCNYVLWTVKRSSDRNRNHDDDSEKLGNLRHNLFGTRSDEDSWEDDISQRESDRSLTGPRLLELLQSRALQPALQELDY